MLNFCGIVAAILKWRPVEIFHNGKFSVSQRQGLITCIPKEGKPKHFLKNWRPITLLNVDYHLLLTYLSNRM
jgi:hypothetical protein